MKANPPRLAQSLVRVFVREQQIEAVTGDLLEEYRLVRRETLGKRRADRWYAAQALGIAGRVVWPGILAIIALRLLSFPLPGGWNPSLVPSPGTSILDAVILVWAGYHAALRTGRAITGIVATVSTGVLGVGSFFVYAVITSPSLLLAPVRTPFVIVIFCTLLMIALTFAVIAGAGGAAVGCWRHSTRQRAV